MPKNLYLATHSIQFRNSFASILTDISVTIHQGDVIALVGDNGAGKSTLMKILAGLLPINRGSITRLGSTWYMPQLDLEIFQTEQSLADYLAGYIEDWWQILDLLESKYQVSLTADRLVKTLSGGELVKLHLALAFYIQPEVLILDEATNHLDIQMLEVLAQMIQDYPYSVLLTSHNGFFLDRVVKRVWELDKAKIREFGGNFSFYRQQKSLELESQLRRYEVALKDKKRLEQSVALEQRRQQLNKEVELKNRHDRSLSRMDRGYFKSKAQLRAGQKKAMYASRQEDNQKLIHSLQPLVQRLVRYTIPSADLQNRGFSIRAGEVATGGQVLIRDINLHIQAGDRIGILGANGVGKSEFLRNLAAKQFRQGDLSISSQARIVYLDQTYSIVNPQQTVLENMQRYNPGLSLSLIRQKLRDFLFWDDYQVSQYPEALSGGQVARLAFAMLSVQPVDILLLDEPTNNLDFSTQEAIIQGLNAYLGSLVIVSHSLDFLASLGVEDIYCITEQSMIKHPLPLQDPDFYPQLLSFIGNSVI